MEVVDEGYGPDGTRSFSAASFGLHIYQQFLTSEKSGPKGVKNVWSDSDVSSKDSHTLCC